MFNDIKQFVRTCPDCQKTKIYPSRSSGLLQPNPIAHESWEEISVDLIMGLL